MLHFFLSATDAINVIVDIFILLDLIRDHTQCMQIFLIHSAPTCCSQKCITLVLSSFGVYLYYKQTNKQFLVILISNISHFDERTNNLEDFNLYLVSTPRNITGR